MEDSCWLAGTKDLSEDDVQVLLTKIRHLKASEINSSAPTDNKLRFKMFGILHFILYRMFPMACVVFYLYQRVSILYEGGTCLISQPALPEFAVAISDCDVCRNMNGSLEIKNISTLEFMRKHAFSSRPLLMKGAALDWPAVELFTFEYFRQLYTQNPESLEKDVNEGQFFAYSSGIKDIGELIEVLGENPATTHRAKRKWYIGWSTDDPFIGSELRKHVRNPYFLPPGASEEHLAWIFMGSPGPGASLHIDWVGRPSWQAQLSGIKTWMLVPPPECEHCCKSLNITVDTGDIIIVNTNFWFHSTFIHPGAVSITFGTEYE